MYNAHPTISIFPHVLHSNIAPTDSAQTQSAVGGPVAVWLQYTASHGPPTAVLSTVCLI